MKKNYQTPVVEKIEFAYREQVVAASGKEPWKSDCHISVAYWKYGCEDDTIKEGWTYSQA